MKETFETMEGLMSLIENSGQGNEVCSLNQIDNSIMQEFLSKLAIWDFFDMSKDEFTSKSDVDRERLILKYYNTVMSGISFCFV